MSGAVVLPTWMLHLSANRHTWKVYSKTNTFYETIGKSY